MRIMLQRGWRTASRLWKRSLQGRIMGKRTSPPSLLPFTGDCMLMSRVVKIGQDERGAKL